MSDFWTANAIAQIAVSLVMITALLMYIAFKLSEKKSSSKSRR